MEEQQEPQAPAQNPAPAEPTPPVDTPAAPQEQPQEPVETPAVDEQPLEQQPEQEKPKPSRAERRIHQLNEKIRQQAQSNQLGPQQPPPQFPRYEEGQQVSPEDLQRDVVQTADAIAAIRVNQQLAQRDAVNYFERDSERLPTIYSELNPDNDTYTPELDEAIAQEYQERAFKVIGYNPQTGEPITQLDPSVRLADIAERQVKAARAYAAKTAATMRTAVSQTADETAPKLTAEPPDERRFEDLSIEEMESRLGYGPQR